MTTFVSERAEGARAKNSSKRLGMQGIFPGLSVPVLVIRQTKEYITQRMPSIYKTSGLGQFLFGFDDETKAKYPHCFTDHNIDRHKCQRVVPMKVLSLGMGRTGTASMKAALTKLGYPTAHGFDMHSNPKDCEMWQEAINAKYFGDTSITLDRAFWDKLLGHVSAVTDMPCNMFGPELIAAYPEAKVILVERDVDKWYPSFEHALIEGTDSPFLWHAIQYLDYKAAHMSPTVWRGMMNGQFRAKDSKEWRANAKMIYTEHYQEIRTVLKDQPERLLNYRLDDGWKPLCEFLGQPIPGGPFPKVNESEQHDEFVATVITIMGRRLVGNILRIAMPVVVGLVAWRYLA
ncbi:uncharacterized protein CLAFUR5_10030 [Fulvia fulva]|uniref:P-loop containing nucleoside triphosphate hydrolase protein n=1 Tax=Passalora fulva TaxID=5499 RepID=A0A9Q8PD61_PASFU|nr:uncharacterized protein CLAFUR5_10030 [Fulvia fulva]UJO20298.1 hypothetical protein CLAFUR5_10030 [Fulvia fulva]